MLLYTLVVKEDNQFKLLGSTFESDVAIYLYYKNKTKHENIYYVSTKTEFHDFGEFEDFNDFELEFFVNIENEYISKLLFEDKLNIYKLKSKYYTESKICSLSEESEIEYSNLVELNDNKKDDILPPNYEAQDDEFFESHYESEVLYVGVLTYPEGKDTNTIVAGASYHEQTSAYLLQNKINELKPKWCHFYFKPIFIFKNQIKDYLSEDKKITFITNSNNVEENLSLIALEKNEKSNDEVQFNCQYMNLTEVPEEELEIFINEHWSKFERDFNPNYYKEEEDLTKEDIISNYISDIRKYYLLNQSDWKDSIELLRNICIQKNITITMDSELKNDANSFTEENIEACFLYLKDCLDIASTEDFYDELTLIVFIRQKTKIQISEGVYQERVAAVFLRTDGLHFISKEDCEYYQTHDHETEEFIFKPKGVSYLDSLSILKVLNTNLEVLDD
jgi:hypothetical protein